MISEYKKELLKQDFTLAWWFIFNKTKYTWFLQGKHIGLSRKYALKYAQKNG